MVSYSKCFPWAFDSNNCYLPPFPAQIMSNGIIYTDSKEGKPLRLAMPLLVLFHHWNHYRPSKALEKSWKLEESVSLGARNRHTNNSRDVLLSLEPQKEMNIQVCYKIFQVLPFNLQVSSTGHYGQE